MIARVSLFEVTHICDCLEMGGKMRMNRVGMEWGVGGYRNSGVGYCPSAASTTKELTVTYNIVTSKYIL